MSTSERHPEQSERSFGRDGISGLLTAQRALRARDVSRPSPGQLAQAEQEAARLLAQRGQTRN